MEKIENNPKYEEKFIVINRKRLEELRTTSCGSSAVNELLSALKTFNQRCIFHDINVSQKYIVCNQDEPYAKEVFDIIIGDEDERKAANTE